MSKIDPNCTACFNEMQDVYWIPCSGGGCSPCGSGDGYRTPQECLTNPQNYPAQDCNAVCYPPCNLCTNTNCNDPTQCTRVTRDMVPRSVRENYAIPCCRPQQYTNLKNTWGKQGRYST
jgi:hypothetical protein